MNRIRVVLIDKDFGNQINLIELKGIKEVEICGFTDELKNGIEIIRRENPDIILLGIELNDGCGFDLLNEFDEYKFQIVFLIPKNDVLERTFSYSGIDYLLKPLETNKFKSVLKKLLDSKFQRENSRNHSDYNKRETKILKTLILPDTNGYSRVDISEIISCQVQNNNLIINMNDKSQYALTVPLCSIEILLKQSTSTFYRIHNNTIINLQYLHRFSTNKRNYVLMTNGVRYDVSHRRKKGLKDLITKQIKINGKTKVI